MRNCCTQIWLYGTLVEVEVDYEVIDDVIEVVKANIVGVYHKGDNPRLRDYTSIQSDIPLWGSEMPERMYDELVTKAEEFEETMFYEYGADTHE
jgi:hypothetical protein